MEDTKGMEKRAGSEVRIVDGTDEDAVSEAVSESWGSLHVKRRGDPRKGKDLPRITKFDFTEEIFDEETLGLVLVSWKDMVLVLLSDAKMKNTFFRSCQYYAEWYSSIKDPYELAKFAATGKVCQEAGMVREYWNDNTVTRKMKFKEEDRWKEVQSMADEDDQRQYEGSPEKPFRFSSYDFAEVKDEKRAVKRRSSNRKLAWHLAEVRSMIRGGKPEDYFLDETNKRDLAELAKKYPDLWGKEAKAMPRIGKMLNEMFALADEKELIMEVEMIVRFREKDDRRAVRLESDPDFEFRMNSILDDILRGNTEDPFDYETWGRAADVTVTIDS